MVEINNKTRSSIDIKLATKVSLDFLHKYKKNNLIVSVAFIGDKKMRQLNKQYRKKDKTTDVLSFVTDKKFLSTENYLGEIIINYQQIKRQAKKYKKSVKQELVFILVHGLLHLVGYDDLTEKQRQKMINLANNFISTLKYV